MSKPHISSKLCCVLMGTLALTTVVVSLPPTCLLTSPNGTITDPDFVSNCGINVDSLKKGSTYCMSAWSPTVRHGATVSYFQVDTVLAVYENGPRKFYAKYNTCDVLSNHHCIEANTTQGMNARCARHFCTNLFEEKCVKNEDVHAKCDRVLVDCRTGMSYGPPSPQYLVCGYVNTSKHDGWMTPPHCSEKYAFPCQVCTGGNNNREFSICNGAKASYGNCAEGWSCNQNNIQCGSGAITGNISCCQNANSTNCTIPAPCTSDAR